MSSIYLADGNLERYLRQIVIFVQWLKRCVTGTFLFFTLLRKKSKYKILLSSKICHTIAL